MSISHEPLMENQALTYAIQNGNVRDAVVDTLAEFQKKELLDTGRVLWTEDSAWKEGFDQNEYQRKIKNAIAGVLSGNFEGILVKSKKTLVI